MLRDVLLAVQASIAANTYVISGPSQPKSESYLQCCPIITPTKFAVTRAAGAALVAAAHLALHGQRAAIWAIDVCADLITDPFVSILTVRP